MTIAKVEKNGRGFYLYGEKGRKKQKQADPAYVFLLACKGRVDYLRSRWQSAVSRLHA